MLKTSHGWPLAATHTWRLRRRRMLIYFGASVGTFAPIYRVSGAVLWLDSLPTSPRQVAEKKKWRQLGWQVQCCGVCPKLRGLTCVGRWTDAALVRLGDALSSCATRHIPSGCQCTVYDLAARLGSSVHSANWTRLPSAPIFFLMEVLLQTVRVIPATVHVSIRTAVHATWTNDRCVHLMSTFLFSTSWAKGKGVSFVLRPMMICSFWCEHARSITRAELLIYLPVICHPFVSVIVSVFSIVVCLKCTKLHVFQCYRFPTTCPRLCTNDAAVHLMTQAANIVLASVPTLGYKWFEWVNYLFGLRGNGCRISSTASWKLDGKTTGLRDF